jgi:hypothetical protein
MESTMSCRQLIDALADDTAATLELGERKRCGLHLANCPRCVDYRREYRETVRLTKLDRTSSPDVAAPIPAEIVDAILAATTRRPH